MALTLYRDSFWISPYVYSVYVALREKNLDFETVPVALERGAQREPGYARETITGRVPALAHDGFVLAESSAIVEYLDTVYSAVPVLPDGRHAMARARQVMAWIRSDDTLAIRQQRPTTTMFYAPAAAPLDAAGAACAAKIIAVAERLVEGRDAFLFGERFTVVDADLGFLLMRLVLNGDPVPEAVARYARRVWARPSVRDFVARERAPYVAY
ncbi:MAG: glutathione transferase [Myxococcales bacterium]|nr:glutathione transferase [Myxococcales bacterium]